MATRYFSWALKCSSPRSNFRPTILALVFVFAAGFAHANESDATRVVEQYFEALHVGDVESIRGLLGGRLLARKERLLSNPTYGEYLRNHYQDYSANVTSAVLDSGVVNVEVELQDAQGDARSLWLKVVRDPATESYRIEEEGEVAADS